MTNERNTTPTGAQHPASPAAAAPAASGSATAPQHPAGPAAVSVPRAVALIARREITTALRSKAVIWSFIILVVIIAVSLLGMRFLGEAIGGAVTGSKASDQVATTLTPQQLPDSATLTSIDRVDSVAEAVDGVKSGKYVGAVLSADSAANLELYDPSGKPIPAAQLAAAPGYIVIGDTEVPGGLLQQLTIEPLGATLELSNSTMPPFLFYFVAIGFGLIFFMSVMLYAQQLSQSVVEEKSSRVVELLISTVRPATMLAGKIIGGTVLALLQLAVIVAVTLTCLAVTGWLTNFPYIGIAVAWFAVFTVIGFMFYASLYAALASTVSRPEEAAAATAPLTYLMMIPYLGPMMFNSNKDVMAWLSYLPFSSPVAMPLRIISGWAAWWEPVAALVLLIAAVAGAIWLSGRIYRNSILRTGKRVKLGEALRGA